VLSYACPDASFLPEKATMAFRVVQEIITNSLKHGKASLISIDCGIMRNRICFTISDNGLGFKTDTSGISGRKSGLRNIASRLELLDARYTLRSVPGTGTSYTIEIPLHVMTGKNEKATTH
jgi:signal transduction histidine kinase